MPGSQLTDLPMYDDITKFNSWDAASVFYKMAISEPTVAACLYSINLPIVSATYYLDGGNQEMRDVLTKALFQGMDRPFSEVIQQALTMLIFGHSVSEITTAKVGKYMLPVSIAPRAQNSLDGAKFYKNGQLKSVKQFTSLSGQVTLPRETILYWVNQQVLGGWRGISLLRPAYKPYFLKDLFQRVSGIMHERWGAGIPMAHIDMLNPTEAVIAKVDKMMENLHANPRGYIRTEGKVEVSTLEGPARTLPDTLAYIRDCGEEIIRAMLCIHLILGGGRSAGSRALGTVFVDAFLQAIQSWVALVLDEINISLIRRTVDDNWGVRPLRNYPVLKARNLHNTALRQLAFLAQSHTFDIGQSVNDFITETLGMESVEYTAPTVGTSVPGTGGGNGA